MSRATKRKHVMQEVQQDSYELPTEAQIVTRVLVSRGNNLHEVESGEGEKFLVSMPTKFRKNVWIKRGDFVLVESIDEGDKVKGEIVRMLSKEHRKIFTKSGVWPQMFLEKKEDDVSARLSNSESDNDDDLVQNTNRLHEGNGQTQATSCTSSSEEDDTDK